MSSDLEPLTVKDLNIAGAIMAILNGTLDPNLVQTIDNTPAIIHGGPFANIAHGCNSIQATKMAMTFGDYAITEAGFGADLGAEKFFDIKCREAGIAPKLTVVVVTLQALKMHGGVDVKLIKEKNEEGVKAGFANMDRHVDNLKKFGQSVVVVLNRFNTDTDEEINLLKAHCEANGVPFAINNAFTEGAKGAIDFARLVVDTIEKTPSRPLQMAYELTDSVEEKINKIARNIYGAKGIELKSTAKKKLKRIEELGLTNLPVCIAKTQYSFSEDATAYGTPTDFHLHIRDLVINAGARMIVAIAGDIMRMPGMPKTPQAEHIDVVDGVIVGLS